MLVLAEAADGYKAAYTLAELDEQFGARTAFAALTQNGRPLSAADGPYRIIMAGEAHRADGPVSCPRCASCAPVK